ncbi:MAG: hypothetical protein H0Z39_00085 [Peptococcaceae bacterium]|nr:hypothetical protein [Peptococcaceae bacterium]
MKQAPDILGFLLDDALNVLQENGWDVTITSTSPPRGDISGPYRVLRSTVSAPGKIELLIARQGWEKGDGEDVFPYNK